MELVLIACGITIVLGTVLGLYAIDWIVDYPTIGNLLTFIGLLLVGDALLSWICGYFPWQWLGVWSFLNGAQH
jgi:hypothetical protein